MAGGYFGGATDYSGLDRVRAQLMDAVNRHAQFESSYLAAASDRQTTRAIGNILADYGNDVSPKQTPPVTAEIPQVETTAIPSPIGLPAYQIPTSVKPVQATIPGATEQPTREDQYNAASRALSRLAQYGPRGLAAGKQIMDNLNVYAKLFPYEKPEQTEDIVGSKTFTAPTGDTATMVLFGHQDPNDPSKNIVTSHQPLNFGWPPGAGKGKGDQFYGNVFKYENPADAEDPTGLNQEVDQTERMKLAAQLDTEEGRLQGEKQAAQTHVDNLIQGVLRTTIAGRPPVYPKDIADSMARSNAEIAKLDKKLANVEKHRTILRSTWNAGRTGATVTRGAGILGKGPGHR